MNVISIGEVLWDKVGAEEHLGGAAFNFAANLARLGHRVIFVSAVGADERGERVLEAMSQMGLSTQYVRRVEKYPTGLVSVSLDQDGHPTFLIHRPAAYDFPHIEDGDLPELFSLSVDWMYFGTLFQMSPQAHGLTERLLAAGKGARRFYDINLRPDSWKPSLVRELMANANMVKMNADEVGEVARMVGQHTESLEEFCRGCASIFGWEGVCVTRGADGCALLLGAEYVEAGGYPVPVVDTVGAGDAFAAAFVHGVGSGWPAIRIADFANRVGAFVSSRPGAVPPWTLADLERLQQGSSSRKNPQSQHRETA